MSAIKYGNRNTTISSILRLATLQPVNKIGPTGGVIVPMAVLKTIITPK